MGVQEFIFKDTRNLLNFTKRLEKINKVLYLDTTIAMNNNYFN